MTTKRAKRDPYHKMAKLTMREKLATARNRSPRTRTVGKHPALAAPYTTSANDAPTRLLSDKINPLTGMSPSHAAALRPPDFRAQVMLVGDIVSGFDAYGPFDSPSSAVDWKQRKGNRELTQGQWFLLPLKGI